MNMKTVKIITKNADETIKLGETLGSVLDRGCVLTFFGDLAAGKTTFTKGLAKGLGISDYVSSPTFTLIHEHKGRLPLYHVDLYRLNGTEEIETIGLDEYLESGGVTVIEWSERFEGELPDERIDIKIVPTGDDEREITFSTLDYEDVLEKLENACSCN